MLGAGPERAVGRPLFPCSPALHQTTNAVGTRSTDPDEIGGGETLEFALTPPESSKFGKHSAGVKRFFPLLARGAQCSRGFWRELWRLLFHELILTTSTTSSRWSL